MIGVRVWYLSDMETGKRNISRKKAKEPADIFKCNPGVFISHNNKYTKNIPKSKLTLPFKSNVYGTNRPSQIISKNVDIKIYKKVKSVK